MKDALIAVSKLWCVLGQNNPRSCAISRRSFAALSDPISPPSLQRRSRRRRKNCGLNSNDVGSIPVLGFLGKFLAPHIPPDDLARIFALRIGNQHKSLRLHDTLYGPDAVWLNPK